MSGVQQVLMALHAEAAGGPPTFVAAETARNGGSDLVIDKPAGTVDGDILLAIIAGGLAPTSAPAGWSLIETQEGASPSLYAYIKAASSEGADYTWGGVNTHCGAILTFRGASATIDVDGSGTFSGVTNPSAPSVTTTGTNRVVIAAQANNDSGNPASAPSGMTEHADLSDGSGNSSLSVATVVQPSSGASGAKQFGLAFSADGCIYTVALSPA